MRIGVIDGRGGGLGCRFVAGLRETIGHESHIIGLGTNLIATEAMRQAGADQAESGIEAMVKILPTVDVILASLNMVLPGAMLGEVTPEIAQAILTAKAKKVLLPVNRVGVEIVGTENRTLDMLIAQSFSRVLMAAQATCSAS